MFTITGATGNVGGETARALLSAGHPVRVVARDPRRVAPDAFPGAEVVPADLGDRGALAAALEGSTGCFVLLPFDPTGTGIAREQARMVDAITGAVADAGVPHVALLSSLGADAADGPAILGWLHQLETALRGTGAVVSTLRCTHFQEKTAEVLEAVRAGVYPVFGDDLDTPVPLVATRDVGAHMATALLAPPDTHQVVDVLGPAYSERELATAVGRAVGTDPTISPVPRPAWVDTLTDAGLSSEAAGLVAELYEAANDGRLRPVGDRQVVGDTPIEATLKAMTS